MISYVMIYLGVATAAYFITKGLCWLDKPHE